MRIKILFAMFCALAPAGYGAEVGGHSLKFSFSDHSDYSAILPRLQDFLEANLNEEVLSLAIDCAQAKDLGPGAAKIIARALENQTTNLNELSLSWCEIGDEGTKALSRAIAKHAPKLKSLSLKGCDGKFSAEHLAPALQSLRTSLEYLDLSANKLDGDFWVIAAALEHKDSTLRTLNLSCNGLNSAQISSFLSFLTRGRFPRLNELDLSENDIDEEGASQLFAALAARNHFSRMLERCCPRQTRSLGLKSLKLERNRIGPNVATKDFARALSAQQVKKLSLSCNPDAMTEEEIEALVDAVFAPEGTCLDELSLFGRLPLHEDHEASGPMRRFIVALNYAGSLTSLSLCEVVIAEAGAKALAKALSEDSMLERLTVRRCGITREGALHLGAGLATKKRLLEVLDIWGNPIGSGILALVSSGRVKEIFVDAEQELAQALLDESLKKISPKARVIIGIWRAGGVLLLHPSHTEQAAKLLRTLILASLKFPELVQLEPADELREHETEFLSPAACAYKKLSWDYKRKIAFSTPHALKEKRMQNPSFLRLMPPELISLVFVCSGDEDFKTAH